MSWMCEAVEVAVIEHWARCGSCGWSLRCDSKWIAMEQATAHRDLHDDIYERSDGMDLGDYLNPLRHLPISENTASLARPDNPQPEG